MDENNCSVRGHMLDQLSKSHQYDATVFPYIVLNNSQYRKRFHITNYTAFKSDFVRDSGTVVPEYRLLTDSRLYEKQLALQTLIDTILPTANLDMVVEQLYREKALEKLQLLALVAAAAEAQAGSTAGKQAAQSFNAISATVFGQPSVAVFNQLIQKIKTDFLTLPETVQATTAFANLTRLFSGTFPTDVPTFTALPLLPSADEGIVTDADEVVKFLTDKMALCGLSDWSVEITHKPIGSFRVFASKKLIRVPQSSVLRNRKSGRRLTAAVMEGIFSHEVLTHVVRAVHGLKSPLRLLSHGLAGYLPGEEGIATFREQCSAGATDYAGATMYLAIGLAYGLDREGSKRSFREVCEILTDYFSVIHPGKLSSSTSKAFATCCRIFVCSPHADVPLILTRDIAYREGNIKIIDLLRQRPDAVLQFDIGKYDPTNSKHVTALTILGIL